MRTLTAASDHFNPDKKSHKETRVERIQSVFKINQFSKYILEKLSLEVVLFWFVLNQKSSNTIVTSLWPINSDNGRLQLTSGPPRLLPQSLLSKFLVSFWRDYASKLR